MKNFILHSFIFLFWLVSIDELNGQNIKSPSDFLGYPLGAKFSYHHKVVDYFNYVGDRSEKVLISNYGKTYESRDLLVAFVSSKENLKKLENLRTNNLKRTQLIEGVPVEDEIAIVWFSYNVHGNEANSTETSMKVLHELATEKDQKYEKWLENLIIIIDPCLNPDGRDRYTNWYNQVSNIIPNPNINSREHHESWAHGRTNHYMFDLNRDWVWQTQIESIQRLALYNDWMPHVHVDFHEQFPNSQYYFAPAANPMHEHITSWQKDFQAIVGKNNANYFDKKGWLYFTKESFDLLYPGYGDTYPMFNGAIGMTYEMPGHSISGLSIKTEKGDTLTLSSRIDMHYTTSMATIEACYQNRKPLIKEFSKYFIRASKKKENYILISDQPDKISLLIELLDKNKIAYKSSNKVNGVKAFSFNRNETSNINIEQNDLVIPVNQPKSTLAKVLFERNTKLADTLTYDITAWSLPFVYGFDAYRTNETLELSDYTKAINKNEYNNQVPYAYLLNWTSIIDANFLSKILTLGFKVSYSTKSFKYEGSTYKAGSIFIYKVDNNNSKFPNELIKIANTMNRKLIPLYSGSSISSMDLGSQKVKYLTKPRVALFSGEGTSSYNFGELWYFFEQEIAYQIDVIEKNWVNNVDLNDYDVIILSSGSYSELQSEEGFDKMDGWIKLGGKLVLFEKAIKGFIGETKFSLKLNEHEQDKDKKEEPILFPYENVERENLKKLINGGIIQMEIDYSHPVAYGYDKNYYTLKNNTDSYKFLEKGWNVGYIPSPENTVSGFVGAKSKQSLIKNLVIGVEQRGKGSVIYFVDNPIFRGFWQHGKLFLANSVFFNN